ncbi:MAG TPA: hypothetical protein VHG90_11345 [Acidimicrobiales bacterium]|nr:hypothetical protein [Acidimicrobiales bacterium]
MAANANVAAPIDAASANAPSLNSDALAKAPQDPIVVQHLDGEAR